ncbi:MAG: nuclear transport factor 2 family protein [Gammaproteobacteria bacterium]
MSKLSSSIVVAVLSILVAGPALADREEDRDAIHALMWKYARALDTWNADAYAALYTEDGQFGVGPNATKGREALRNMISGFTSGDNPPPALLHMTADTWIEFIDDTHANHHSYWITMRKASEGSPAAVAAVGVGVDELVKVDGQWLIKVRNTTADQ